MLNFYSWIFVTYFGLLWMTSSANCSENFTERECTEPLCLKCGPSGCIKCPDMIVFPTRKCVSSCPFGTRPTWSTYSEYMGLICVPNGNFLGLSYDLLAIIAGVVTGTILCVIFVTSTLLYFKYRRKEIPRSIESNSDIEELPERRREFLKKLESLKPSAQCFLDMLNDTRRRVRCLHHASSLEGGGNGDTCAIQAYRPVVRDLTKILILINRDPEKVCVPDDWEHLLGWAEQTLQRYKRMSENSQVQMSQLVNFLQNSAGLQSHHHQNSSTEDFNKGSTTMSTFKPDQPSVTASSSLQDIAVQNFNQTYDSRGVSAFNPQWKFQYSLISSGAPSTEFNPAVWKNSKEYLNSSWLMDDEFLQLGFRPQDEITTEL